MFTPLRSFNSLVPNNLDVQWKIQFTEDDRYFVTTTSGAKPTFQITGSVTSATVLPLPSFVVYFRPCPLSQPSTHNRNVSWLTADYIADCTMYVLCCLLRPEAELSIQRRLSTGTLQIPFMGDTIKSYWYCIFCSLCFMLPYWFTTRLRRIYYLFFFTGFFRSVESGRIQAQIDITLKDPFQSCCVILSDNVTLVGALNTHHLKWERHNLQHIFLETGLSIKSV